MSSNHGWAQQTQQVLEKGFTQFKLQDTEPLKKLQKKLLQLAREKTQSSIEKLEDVHQFVKAHEMNDFRLSAISLINQDTEFRKSVIDQVLPFLKEFLGQDLAVQKNLNLVLLAPHDLTSQLPLHADTWTGHSPFELAMLVPLSEVMPDQSMFILPRAELKNFKVLDSSKMTLQEMTQKLKGSLDYLKLSPGEVFFFWHNMPHGNSENKSSTTHWSLNLRFKNIFTPYGQKKLGDYFVPLTNSPFTEMVFEEAAWKP